MTNPWLTNPWPKLPYKGLSYYGPQDVELFAGREDDITRIAQRIAVLNTVVFILHGRTGCGKSSFLRAGLIPFLERPAHGFRFLKDSNTYGSSSSFEKAVFIRSTDDPVARLAEEMDRFLSTPLLVETPAGAREVDVRALREKYGADAEALLSTTAIDCERMTAFLADLAEVLPGTLVLVIDQAEEVLTLSQPFVTSDAMDRFFGLLARLDEIAIDVKVLISIRTEFFGEFLNEVYTRLPASAERIGHEILRDLGFDQAVDAIRYPAIHEVYSFGYEDGLPERIARDLKRNPAYGGSLAVMQVICSRLYRVAQGRVGNGDTRAIISHDDYERLGGIDAQVDGYLRDALEAMCREESVRDSQVEVYKWYEVLGGLVRPQVDGTVTTEQKTDDELYGEAMRLSCTIDFTRAVDFLASESQRILQRSSIFNVAIMRTVVCYSLGHDAIGLALRSWRTRHQGASANSRKLERIVSIFLRMVSALMFLIGVLIGAVVLFEMGFRWNTMLFLIAIMYMAPSVFLYAMASRLSFVRMFVRRNWRILRMFFPIREAGEVDEYVGTDKMIGGKW